MAPRPTDWNVLGLERDPTPGDPQRIDDIVTSLRDLGSVAREVDTALDTVINKNGPDAFAGHTADALREKIGERLRNFVQSLAEAFEWSAAALSTYVTVVREEQWRADNALSQARALPKNDPGIDGLAGTARTAGTTQSTAAATASGKIDEAYRNIKQPTSPCDDFWEIFKWLAIALILPALVFGGPIALVAIGVNLVLFIKTAVDFAQGKAGVLELFLAALGIVAPTTRAVPIFQLLASGAKLAWSGIKAGALATFRFFSNLARGVFSHPFVLFPGLHDLVMLTGSWVKGGALWVRGGITAIPGLAVTGLSKAGLLVVSGIKGVWGLVQGIGPGLKTFAISTGNFLNREFGGNRWLRLFLPAEADELHLGVWNATKLAIWDRGVLGRHIYGLPRPHVPPGVLPEQHVSPPQVQLAELRAGDLAVPPMLQMPALGNAGALGRFTPAPPTLHVPTTFGDSFQFSGASVRSLDALLNSPIDSLASVRIGEWANRGALPTVVNTDHVTGVSAALHIQLPATNGLHMAGVGQFTGGGPLPTAHLASAPAPVPNLGGTLDGLMHQPASSLTGGIVGHTPVADVHLTSVPAMNLLATGPVDATAVHALGTMPAGAVNGAHIAGHTSLAIGAQHIAMDLGTVARPGLDLPPPTVNPVHSINPTASVTVNPTAAVTVNPAATVHPTPAVNQIVHTAPAPPSPVHAAPSPVHVAAGPPTSTAPVHSGTQPANQANVDAALGLVHTNTTVPSRNAHAVPHDLPAASPALAGHNPRLTPSDLDRAWQHDSDRIGALFGASGDPQRGARLDAWADYTQARYDLGRAQERWDDLYRRPGESSRGPTPAQVHADIELRAAQVRVEQIEQDLHALGVNPGTMDARIADVTLESLRERPRLLGGGQTQSQMQASYPLVDLPAPHGADGAATGLRVDVHVGEGGTRTLRLVDADGVPVPNRVVTEHGGGVQITDTTPGAHGAFDRFDGQGTRVETGTPFHGTNTPMDGRFVVAGPDGALLRVEDAGGQNVGHLVPSPHGGGVQVTNTAEHGAFHRFDADGQHIQTGVPLRDGSGTRLPERFLVTYADGSPLHLEATGSFVVAPHNGGFQVTDTAAHGAFHRFDAQGGHIETGRPFHGTSTPLDGHILATQPDATPLRVEDAGGRNAGHLVPSPHQGGVQVTNTAEHGAFHRFDANGQHAETGVPLRDAGGTRLPDRFLVTHVDGSPLHLEATGSFVVAPHNGGFQITDTAAHGAFHRFDAHGQHIETGRPFHGTNTPLDGHVLATRPDGAPLRVEDAGGQNAGHLVPSPHGGGVQVTNTGAHGAFHRFDAHGQHIETGRPFHGTNTPMDGRFVVARPDGTPLRVEDAGGQNVGHLVPTPHQGGVQVTNTAADGTFHRFDANGQHTETGVPLRDGGGTRLPDRFLVTHADGTPPHLEVTSPNLAVAAHAGGFQITDTAAHGAFHRFDAQGQHIETGTPFHGTNTPLDGHVLATRPDGAPLRVEDAGGQNVAHLVPTPHHGGVQVTNTAANGTFRRFDGAMRHTETGTPFHNTGTSLDGHFVVAGPGGAPLRVEHNGQPVPHLTSSQHLSGIQVTDTAANNAFRRFDAAMQHTETGVPLRNAGGMVDRQFAVTNPAGAPLRVETAAGPARYTVTVPAGGGFQVTDTVRVGEFRRFDPNGNLTQQAFRPMRNGAPGGRILVLDMNPGGTPRWHTRDAAGNPIANPRTFQHGKVDLDAAANGRIRLLTDAGVPVFERRVLSNNLVMDVSRPVDGEFGVFAQRPHWTTTRADGTVADYGLRHSDTDAASWHHVSHTGVKTHHFRTAIGGGDVVAHRDGLGLWRWDRYDSAGGHLGSGSRTWQRDGGWTDRLDGAPRHEFAQRQWSAWHRPDNSRMYQQFDLVGGVRQDTWKRHTPQLGDGGKLERLPDGTTLETHRWAEQRLPNWFRSGVIGIDGRVLRNHQFLRHDTNFQLYTTRMTSPAGNVTEGFRFRSMNGALLDIAADGRFLRYTGPLDHLGSGNNLKVGHDLVPRPAGVARDDNLIPWTEGPGKLSGHRIQIAPGAHPDGRIWEDRFTPHPQGGNWYNPAGVQWRVARAGYADGTVKEFGRPPTVGTLDGGLTARRDFYEVNNGPWARKDPHGVTVGRQDLFPDAHGNPTRMIRAEAPATRGPWGWSGYNARTDAKAWQWAEIGPNGVELQHGTREIVRGTNDFRLGFDESFKDFRVGADGVRTLIRDRHVLGGGAYVDGWRVDTAAAGGHRWDWRKVDQYGNVVDYHATGTRREWWDPAANGGAGAWVTHTGGGTFFRDQIPTAGANLVVREIPTHAPIQRVREYHPGGTTAPPPGTWAEFDFGTTTRSRIELPGGHFLEREPWRGQWREYDVNGVLVAKRNEAGYVFARPPGGQFHLVGRDLDARGVVTELRGWSREIREANRTPFHTDFHPQAGPTAGLGEALYQPHWQLVAQKVALEFGQEFLLEFGANLIVNGVVDAIAGTEFNGLDVAKAAANAVVGAGLKVSVGALVHDNRIGFLGLQRLGDFRAGLTNLDIAKAWLRRPLLHDRHWNNDWGGNEFATRWRQGTYDYFFNIPVAALTNFVNGAINAAVFGINVNGQTVKVTGGAAAYEGALGVAAGVTGAFTSGVLKHGFITFGGGRMFHRAGMGELGWQFVWKIGEKSLATALLLPTFRADTNPWYVQP